MLVLRLLLVLSLALSALGWLMPELWFGAALPLGGISTVALLWLIGQALLAGRRPRRAARVPDFCSGPQILVDGSNVLHWAGEGPNLQTLQGVLQQIKAQKPDPVVYFDANVGYLLGDRWMGPVPMARRLGMDPRKVVVADKGTPADPLLLAASRTTGARIVSNDRYRDWHAQFPEAADPSRTVRGRVDSGSISLAL